MMNKHGIQIGRIVVLIMMAGGAVNAQGVHAPITSEMLTTLRASRTINAAHNPGRGILAFEVDRLRTSDQIISLDFPDDNADIMSSRSALEEAFNILISLEGFPVWSPHVNPDRLNNTFAYVVNENARLFDALERLVEACKGNVRWRLVNGHIILTEAPIERSDTAPIIGDRIVRVDINSSCLHDALLQLETYYNEQYTDYALTIRPTYFRDVAHMIAAPEIRESGMIVLQQKDTLRNIIVNLLAQTGESRMKYLLSASRAKQHDGLPAIFLEREELLYYTLSYSAPPLDKELNALWKAQQMPMEEERLWLDKEFESQRQRLRQYLLRNHPDIAALANQTPYPGNADTVEQ